MTANELKTQIISKVNGLNNNNVLDQICAILELNKCDKIKSQTDQSCEDLRTISNAFYSKLFRNYGYRCIILDFFVEDKYLGYVKFYPIGNTKIGETALSLPEDSGKNHLACWTYFKRIINGKIENIVSAPYMEQDGHVGACAQVALWIACRILSRNKGGKDICVPKITENATEFNSRGPIFPTQGLYWDQMMQAISSFGFSPLMYAHPEIENKPKIWYPDGIIYRYIESNIPIILNIDKKTTQHAIVAVGYRFKDDFSLLNGTKPPGGYYTPASFLESFIIHDDQLGPYRYLPCLPVSEKDNTIEEPFHVDYNLLEHVTFLLAPLPSDVVFFGEDAEARAYYWCKMESEIRREVNANTSQLSVEFTKAIEEQKIVLHTFLIERREWLKERRHKKSKLTQTIIEIYESIDLPDYLWVVEITTIERFCLINKNNNKINILGEAIIDPTATRDAAAVLLFHIPGILMWITNPREHVSTYRFYKEYKPTDYLGCTHSTNRRFK